MPELRIALIMGGGVSLGSFSAGALSRVLRLLPFVERGPARIDVMTGASAGSMTLGVVLYHLFRGSSLATMEAALRSAWVQRISFDELCPDVNRHDMPSLFSDRIIREIAEEELRFDGWQEDAPHPYFAEGAVVSFALTNLNGIPVRAEGQIIRQASAGGATASGPKSAFADAVQTTFHDDVLRFVLRREAGEEEVDGALRARVLRPWRTDQARRQWTVFREAAIASGAFPGAFPPVRLERSRSEYGIWPEELERDRFTFDYVDGGVLRNEPLREAIQLAAARDRGQDVERVFILIDPNVSGTREVYALAHNQSVHLRNSVDDWGELIRSELTAPTYMARLGGVVSRLMGVLASQATFRDWLRAAQVNSQIEWRDELTGILDMIEPRPGSDAEGRIDSLIEKIYFQKEARALSGDPDEAEVGRIRRRIAEDLSRRTEGSPDFTTKVHLLVDLIAGLREKRKINMVAITPAATPGDEPVPIAGNFLSNFGGFFNERYRAYDFSAGEYVANSVLTESIGGAKSFLRSESPELARPAPPDPNPSYRNLSAGIQQRFERLVSDHVRAAAPLMGLPTALHGIVAGKVRGRVRSALVAAHGTPEATFVVEIDGARDLFLRAAPSGRDVAPDSSGRIRTVVVARKSAPHPGGPGLYGPHVHGGANGTPATLELWERRLLRPARRVATVAIEGDAGDYYRRVRFSSIPKVRIDFDRGAERLALVPELLAEG